MKRASLVLFACFAVFVVVGCTAGSSITVGPGNLHSQIEVHEFDGFGVTLEGDFNKWSSSAKLGVVTVSAGGGTNECKGASAEAHVDWSDGS